MKKEQRAKSRARMQSHNRSPNKSLLEEMWAKMISWVIHDNMREWQNVCMVLKRFNKTAHAPAVYQKLKIEDIQPLYPLT